MTDLSRHGLITVKADPVALLVDGENLSSAYGAALLKVAKEYGMPTVRRVYGKAEHILGWEQEGYRLVATRPGKNAADILLCTEAVILALRECFHTILIASSDSDYAYVAEHLRELGHEVIGIGESKTPRSYRETCSGFVELHQVNSVTEVNVAVIVEEKFLKPATKIIPQLRKILCLTNDVDGWGQLPWLERHLLLADPNFAPMDYGFADLENLLKSLKFFEFGCSVNGKIRLRDPYRKVPKAQLPVQVQMPEVDRQIRGLILSEGIEFSIGVAKLGTLMRQCHSKFAKDCGAATWSSFLRQQEDKYELSPNGGNPVVRLKHP